MDNILAIHKTLQVQYYNKFSELSVRGTNSLNKLGKSLASQIIGFMEKIRRAMKQAGKNKGWVNLFKIYRLWWIRLENDQRNAYGMPRNPF